MTPKEQARVEEKLKEVAEILYKNTPTRELKTFESIELSVREHLLETVAPEIGNFFFTHPHFSQTLRSQSLKALCSQSLTLLI